MQPDLLPLIRRTFAEATRGIDNEVPAVWALFDNGFRNLRRVLRTAYRDRISVNAVFCHGHPRAHFQDLSGHAQSCEAGDLLVAVHHRAGPFSLRRSALLLQLKMLHKDSFVTTQIDLYHRWPRFEFRYGGKIADHQVMGGEHRGAQFAFIDRSSGDIAIAQGPNKPRWMPSRGGVVWDELLAAELLLMMTSPATGGRDFVDIGHNDPSGWSPVVWDLLRTTFSASTYVGKQRVLDRAALNLVLEDALPLLLAGSNFASNAEALWAMSSDFAGDIPPPDNDAQAVPFDGPISTVLIEIDWQRADRG